MTYDEDVVSSHVDLGLRGKDFTVYFPLFSNQLVLAAISLEEKEREQGFAKDEVHIEKKKNTSQHKGERFIFQDGKYYHKIGCRRGKEVMNGVREKEKKMSKGIIRIAVPLPCCLWLQ